MLSVGFLGTRTTSTVTTCVKTAKKEFVVADVMFDRLQVWCPTNLGDRFSAEYLSFMRQPVERQVESSRGAVVSVGDV